MPPNVSAAGSLTSQILAGCRRDRAVITAILTYIAGVMAVAWLLAIHIDVARWFSRIAASWLAVAPLTLVFILMRAVRVAGRRRSRRLARMWHDLAVDWSIRQRATVALPTVFLLPVFFQAFCTAKSMIPLIQPFAWDPFFERVDRVLHGGLPWVHLQPLLGYTWITWFLDLCYGNWFVIWVLVLYWQIFSLRPDGLRTQFLLSFCLCWVLLGTGVATLFSSAGPCFYERVTGGTEYRVISDYLSHYRGPPLLCIPFQEELWSTYEHGTIGSFLNISAMPSMHASISFLLVLFGRRIHRLLAVAFGALAAAVCLACIHLGWHYAIDIYVAIAVTWLIWWAVGRFTRADDGTGPSHTGRRSAKETG